LNEFIHFKILDELGRPLVDDDGDILRSSEFKIARKNIKAENLKEFIQRSPMPDLEIDFFTESETNDAFWLEDLKAQAKSQPMYYVVIPIRNKVPDDILNDPKYEGQTILVVANVPLMCKDESQPVDVATLREWFLCAIIEVDPSLVPFREAIEEAKKSIKPIEFKMKEVAKMQFKDKDGQPMVGAALIEERKMVYQAYLAQKKLAEAKVAKEIARLNKEIEWRRRINIDFLMMSVDDNAQTASWQVRLYGVPNASELEDLLLEKGDWAGRKSWHL
jgi:hypothetical protein